MLVQDAVQHHLEPIKCSKIKGFRGAVQDVQDCFILRIYKNIKSLKFNDSLKIIYNRYKRADVEPCTIKIHRNPVKSRLFSGSKCFCNVEPRS
jgi:hypothetical protein